MGFVQDALDTAVTEHGVDYDDYDTAFVLSQDRLSRPFYQGDAIPAGRTTIPYQLGLIEVRIPTEAIADRLPVAAYDTAGGRIDAAYDAIDGHAWRHELGHSLGPDSRIGLPDLYDMTFGNLGTIGPWGLMGTTGDTISSYCRVLGGDFVFRNHWLEPDRQAHLLDDTVIDLQPLTEADLGDDAEYVTSVYGEFTVDVDLLDRDVSVSPENFHLRTYVLEARQSGTTSISDPKNGGTRLEKSPSNDDGVAVYRFGVFNVDARVDLERILEGREAIEIDDVTPIALEYVPNRPGSESEPTLSLDKSSRYETYVEDDAGLTFELEDSVGSGDPTVRATRDPESLLGDGAKWMARAVGELDDFFGDLVDDVEVLSPHEEPLPGIDILAETPDGRRAGIDPATGEVYEEIEGSRVSGTDQRPTVSVPGDVDASFTFSARRVREELRARGYEPPEELPYERTLIVDRDLSIRDDDGVPILDGRRRYTVKTTLGGDEEPGVIPADVDVSPETLNANSNGKFVTATVAFDRDVGLENVDPETIVLEDVPAVSDDKYGFVRDPVVERDGSPAIEAKFDRGAVLDALEPGEQTVAVTGVVDGATFRGTADLDVIVAGGGRSGAGNGGAP